MKLPWRALGLGSFLVALNALRVTLVEGRCSSPLSWP
jgi:hypothetical protein